MALWRMRIACWIPKATNTHSKYIMLIVCPLQQKLHKRSSMLRYTYIACLAELHYYRNVCWCWLLFLCPVAVLLINTPAVNTGICFIRWYPNPRGMHQEAYTNAEIPLHVFQLRFYNFKFCLSPVIPLNCHLYKCLATSMYVQVRAFLSYVSWVVKGHKHRHYLSKVKPTRCTISQIHFIL